MCTRKNTKDRCTGKTLCPRWDSNRVPGLAIPPLPGQHKQSGPVPPIYDPLRSPRCTLCTPSFCPLPCPARLPLGPSGQAAVYCPRFHSGRKSRPPKGDGPEEAGPAPVSIMKGNPRPRAAPMPMPSKTLPHQKQQRAQVLSIAPDPDWWLILRRGQEPRQAKPQNRRQDTDD